MSLENPSPSDSSGILSDDELRGILDAAEQRKQADLNHKSRIVSIILIVPTVLILGSAAVFLLTYQNAGPPAKPEPVAAAPSAPVTGADREADAAFDSFRPAAQRVNPPATPAKPAEGLHVGGQVINKGDIEFAARLFNFSNAADKPEPKK